MKAIPIHTKSVKAIDGKIKEAIGEEYSPTLAIVFMSIAHDIDQVIDILKKYGVKIFGVTTHGEFINDEIEKESIAILLLNLEERYFESYLEPYSRQNYRETAGEIARKANEKWSNPVFLIAGSQMDTDAEELLLGIQDVVGSDANVYGCMAGDDFTFNEQFVFSTKGKTSQGISSIAFDGDKIELSGRALCGWKSVGTEKIVTKSEANRVFTIDHVPALDIIAKFGGIKDPSEENENLLFELATLCPLQLQRECSPPVMRPGLVVNWEDRSIFCSGKVQEGSKVKFSLPPDFDAIDEVINGCREIKKDIDEVDAIIYITCAGRLITFGPVMSEEIKGILEVWDVPMIGMFSNAELGRAKGGDLEMHNLSSCCVVIKEN